MSEFRPFAGRPVKAIGGVGPQVLRGPAAVLAKAERVCGSGHLNVSVTVRVRLPLLAMTVKAYCPGGAKKLVVTVGSVLALVERVCWIRSWRWSGYRQEAIRWEIVPVMPPSAIVLELNPSNENGHAEHSRYRLLGDHQQFTMTGTNRTDFSQSNHCGSSLAGAQAARSKPSFKPSASGTRRQLGYR